MILLPTHIQRKRIATSITVILNGNCIVLPTHIQRKRIATLAGNSCRLIFDLLPTHIQRKRIATLFLTQIDLLLFPTSNPYPAKADCDDLKSSALIDKAGLPTHIQRKRIATRGNLSSLVFFFFFQPISSESGLRLAEANSISCSPLALPTHIQRKRIATPNRLYLFCFS